MTPPCYSGPAAVAYAVLRRKHIHATVLLGIVLAAPVAAEEPPAGAAAPAAAPEAPPVIDPADVAGAAEGADAALRALRSVALSTPDETRIDAELPALERSLRERAETTGARLEGYLSLDSLGDLESQWRLPTSHLADERNLLADHARRLDAELARLEQMRGLWERSRDTARQSGAPQPVLERIDALLREIAQARAALQERRSAVLTLQSRVGQLELVVGDVMEGIQEARVQERQRLLVRDSPPLWAVLGERAPAGTLAAQLRASWAEERTAVREFVAGRSGPLAAQGAFFVAVLAVAIALGRRAAHWAVDDEKLAAAARILSRPFSAALVVALMAGRWFHASIPNVLVDLATAILVFPVMRLLPERLQAWRRPSIWALVALYVLDRLRDLLGSLPLAERGLLLVESLAAVLFLIWLLSRPWSQDLGPVGLWLRAIGMGLRAGLVLFGIALVANLVGNVNLARLLTKATIQTYLGAVILYAAAQVLDGLVAVALRTRTANALRMVRNHAPLLRRRAVTASHVLMTLYWGWFALGFFAVREAVLGAVGSVVTARIGLGALDLSLGDLLIFGLVLWGTFLFSRLLRFVLAEDVTPRLSLPRGVPYAVSYVLHYGILLLGFLLAVAAAGMDLSRFALVVGALGVGIGFGLQNVVNNFISGLILLFERPVQVGDTVQIGDVQGEVRRIGIRSSTVRTWQGAEVIVPNGNLLSEQVVNWTLSDRERRIEIPVGVAYGSDPRRVLDLLLEVGRKHPGVLSQPEPLALFQGFGESSLGFELRVWTSDAAGWVQIKSEIGIALNDALREAGIKIPFPQRDLHLRSAAPGLESLAAVGSRRAEPDSR